jgi:mannan endo-1,4-beta-mannosidase
MSRANHAIQLSRRAVLGGAAGLGATLATGVAVPEEATAAGTHAFGMSVSGSANTALGAAQAEGQLLGRAPQIVNAYQAWQWRLPFPAQYVADAHAAGVVPQITWEPWDPRLGTSQPLYRLSALSAYDGYVDAYAAAAAASGLPVNLRFAHEMNGTWYPWAVGQNGNTAADYVAAFRRLHARFAAAGARNVTWTWSVNVIPGMSVDIAGCYPGDDVVDVISIDGYDWDGTRTPAQVFSSTLAKTAQVGPGKPWWINEVGTVRTGSRGSWIGSCFSYFAQTPVQALLWFEVAVAGGTDWRLTATSSSTQAARRALTDW